MRYTLIVVIGLFMALTPRASAQFAISPDGKRSATGVVNQIKIEDVVTQKELIRINGHSQRVTTLAYTPEGRFLISGSLDKTVKLWDAAVGRLVREIRIDAAVSSVDSNGKTVTIIDDQKRKREFEIETGREVKK